MTTPTTTPTATTTSNPLEQVLHDWQAAKAANDPHAPFGTLLTVTAEGAPTGRILGLREVRTDGKILVYTNSTSPKWHQLSANPHFELLLFWTTPNMVQYRIRGSSWTTVDEPTMRTQWDTYKPHRSKLLDYYYQNTQAQSSELAGGRQEIVHAMQQLSHKFDKTRFASHGRVYAR